MFPIPPPPPHLPPSLLPPLPPPPPHFAYPLNYKQTGKILRECFYETRFVIEINVTTMKIEHKFGQICSPHYRSSLVDIV